MSPRFLAEVENEICFPITLIMTESIKTGIVPDEWKQASVSLIYKKGSKNCIENYRPISLTSQICKLLESIIRDAVVDHLERNGLISDNQHGFRKGGSCLSNLLQFLDKVTLSLIHI